ncbi:hypothetical protein [Nisaea sp.]|uniref:hypothetical protein n=1 Tax=Nisaea sp. TaxID=2024842 RepID=UPI003297C9E2
MTIPKSPLEALSALAAGIPTSDRWLLHPDGIIQEVKPPQLAGFMVARDDGGISIMMHHANGSAGGYTLDPDAAKHLANLILLAAGESEGGEAA